MDALTLVLAILSSYRLTRLLTKDSLMEPFRDRLEAWCYDAALCPPDDRDCDAYRSWNVGRHYSRTLTVLRGKLGDLLLCPFCAGFYISLGVVALLWHGGIGARFVLAAFAVAGGQTLLATWERPPAEPPKPKPKLIEG